MGKARRSKDDTLVVARHHGVLVASEWGGWDAFTVATWRRKIDGVEVTMAPYAPALAGPRRSCECLRCEDYWYVWDKAMAIKRQRDAAARAEHEANVNRLAALLGHAGHDEDVYGEDDSKFWSGRACRTVPRGIFYPTYAGNDPGVGHRDLYDQAKAVCRECPIQERCLDYALAHGMIGGVWGGMDPIERDGLSGRRQTRARRAMRAVG